MAKIEHFEIPADDVERAQAFYGGVFRFSFDKWDDDNIMIRPGDGGIGGDIHKRSAIAHATFVITVDDIDAALASVEGAGGKRIGDIESMGSDARYAYFEDPEGNVIGVYETSRTQSPAS
jgi:predicted enzyme related to lactoylglutathione lyase